MVELWVGGYKYFINRI